MSNVASYYFLDNLPAAVLQFANSRSSEMVISDGSKKKTVLLGVAGTGETDNGPLNVSTCVNLSYNTFNGASATAFHAVKDAAGAEHAGSEDEIALVAGALYKTYFDAALTVSAGSAPKISFRAGLGAATTWAPPAQVTVVNGANLNYITELDSRTGVLDFASTSTDRHELTVSNLAVGKVLTPSTSGIWFTPISEEAGFNPNAASHTYTIYGRRRLVGNGGYWA